MLVIISDLHLTDGTSGETIRVGAFRAFRERLRDLAYDASWRRDGKYRPIEELHLVLLGDILDVIRSTRWLRENGTDVLVRPWDNSQSQDFISKVSSITAQILEKNADSLGVLKSLDDGKTTTIPQATADGKPAKVGREPDAENRQPVRVHIHYLVGNHDWFYHLPGPAYNQIRKAIAEAIGLMTPATRPFPHDPFESEEIRQIYDEHRVFARHGDKFDPFNFEGDRNTSSLGDAIVVELVNRFAMTVNATLGGVLPQACIDGLKEIDNVRPTLMIPIWVDGLLQKTCPDESLQKRVKGVWDQLVDNLLQLKFVRSHDSLFNLFDSVDKLEWGLKFSKGVFRGNFSRLFAWISEKFGSRESSYYPHAASEDAFKSRRARFVVYGHTHHHEMVPLDSTVMTDGVLDQIYINSGTWRPYHELARLHPEQEEFVRYQVMTYVAFYKDDERRGRLFETWSGTLGVPSSPTA